VALLYVGAFVAMVGNDEGLVVGLDSPFTVGAKVGKEVKGNELG